MVRAGKVAYLKKSRWQISLLLKLISKSKSAITVEKGITLDIFLFSKLINYNTSHFPEIHVMLSIIFSFGWIFIAVLYYFAVI